MAAGRQPPTASSRSRIGSTSSSYFAERDSVRDRDFSYRDRDHDRESSFYYKEKERERDRSSRDREGERYRERDREKERDHRDGGKPGRSSWYEEGEVGRRVSPLTQRPTSFPESPPSNDDTSGINSRLLVHHQHHRRKKSSERHHHAAKDAEKEPGEVSSGSRSEEAEEECVAGPVAKVLGGKFGNDSPSSRKRKYSPIVWDLDERVLPSKSAALALGTSSVVSPPTSRQTLSTVSPSPPPAPLPIATSSSLTPTSSPAQPVALHETSLNACGTKTTTPSNASTLRTILNSTVPAVITSSPISSSSRSLPGQRSLSLSPPLRTGRCTNKTAGTPSPLPRGSRHSPYFAESSVEKDMNTMHFPHQLSGSLSGDGPESGQLLNSPFLDDLEESTPRINIAASRWADESESPQEEAVKSPKSNQQSLDLETDGGQYSPQQGAVQQDSIHSISPEPGEYIRDKHEALSSGGSAGKDHEQNIGLEEQYDKELNERELMELDEDVHDDGEEEQPEPESDEDVPAPVLPPQRTIDMLQGCRSVDEFERLNKIDEGTYGVVYRARNKKTGEIVALKKVKMEKEREGFPMTSLREINVLLSFHHSSIVDVKEVVVGSNLDSIYMVMEYMEHDLKGLMETMKQPFSQSEVKCLMLQLLEGIKYLHDNWVLHRDLKTSNLLLNNRGELKICDFGLARQYGSPLKTYTHMVVTLWYRAPELLLGTKQYSTAIDMWSAGCIMAEFLAKEPLFNGKSELDQLDKIFKTLGTPNEKIWPDFVNLPGLKCNFVRQPFNKLREKFPPTAFAGRPTLSESGFDLLNRLLTYDPKKRITAEEALKHGWFTEVPLPKVKEMMPTFPARSEHERRIRRLMKSPDPLEEQRKKEMRQNELGGGGLFG